MTRLLLRIAFGMVIVVIGAFVIVTQGALRMSRAHVAADASLYTKLIGQAYVALWGATPDQLPAKVARLKKRSGVQALTLRRLADVELDDRSKAMLARGDPVVRLRRRRRTRVYVPLSGARVLEIGPLTVGARADYFPIGWVVAGIALLVGLVAFGLTARIVERLRRLEVAANKLAEGDLAARADIGGKDAIAIVGHRFNLMAERLEKLLDQKQQLLRAVSHELRTPVSRIRFGIQMLPDDASEKLPERIAALNEDIDELEALVEELLLYLRIEGAPGAFERETIDPLAAVAQIVERARQLPHERPVTIEIDAPAEAEIEVAVEPRFFRRAIENLVSNACRHAERRVQVLLAPAEHELVVVVQDDGSGVAEAEREQIFEPFARLDESRSRDAGGVGLGLAIVRQVVAAHGGRVWVEAAEGGGARFVTSWPVRRDWVEQHFGTTRGDQGTRERG